jgi:hypothetical protein
MTAACRIPVLVATLLLAVALAPPAAATEAIFLGWNDCPLGASSAQTVAWSCGANGGSQALMCSFRVGAPVDSVLGIEVVVDLQHADAALPDWWHVEYGGCRAGALQAYFTFGTSACADFLGGDAAGGLQDYTVGRPRGGANQAEIRAAAALLPSYGYATLDTTHTYDGARLVLSNARTSSCTGCLGAACLVLNSVRILRQPGAIGGDVLLTTPGFGDANWAYWQGGTANCSLVPVRKMTWGQVKGLYR